MVPRPDPDERARSRRRPAPTARADGAAGSRSARRRVPVAAGVVALLGLATLGGCSSGAGDEPASSTSSGITLPGTLSVPSSPTTTAAPGPTSVPGTDPGPNTTASSTAGRLQVGDFVVRAPATCSGATYTASLSWTATGAAAATVLVDGAQVAAPVPVGGPFDVVLGCNGSAHAVTLVLADGTGATMIRTQAVSATPEG